MYLNGVSQSISTSAPAGTLGSDTGDLVISKEDYETLWASATDTKEGTVSISQTIVLVLSLLLLVAGWLMLLCWK
jgi:hypothetical protein